jgi:hypothetical protein
MNFSPAVFQKNQSVDASGVAFVPGDPPRAEAHRSDVRDPGAGRPTLDTTEDRRRAERPVVVPIEELRLLASHSGAGGHSSTKRTARVRVALLIAGVVAVAALLGWQHRGDEVKQIASSSLASLVSPSLVNPSGVATVEKETVAASRVDAPSAVGSEQGSAQTAASDRTAGTVDELQQQLQSIADNLSVMKQNLEQLAAKQQELAAKQQQMSRDIAVLGTVKQDDKVNTAARPPRSVAPPPQKRTQALPPPPAAPRPLSPGQASEPRQQDVVARPPQQQDVTGRSPQRQDVVVRPPMPLRQE